MGRYDKAFYTSETVGAIPALLSSCETLYSKARRVPRVDDWSIARKVHARRPSFVRHAFDVLANDRVNSSLHAIRIVANVALIISPSASSKVRGIASLSSGMVTGILGIRESYGTDGADQVTIITQLANGVARLSNDRSVQVAALWHIGIQSTLSYTIAGWAKVAGRPWREGAAVNNILRTRTYGHEGMWNFFRKRPSLSRWATWGVVVWECSFPAIYVLPPTLAKLFVGSAMAFHIVNGQAMGLWRFVFAFGSMHPALLATISRNDDGLRSQNPLSANIGLMLAGLGIASAARAKARRARIMGSQSSLHLVETLDGNELYADIRRGSREGLVVVFEAGMLALPEHFGWLRTDLEREGYSTVTYYRAGYGPSQRGSGADYRLEESVRDLAGVLEAVARPSDQVILIGHSLGAEISRRYVTTNGNRRVGSIIYVDPAHPNEFSRSEAQSKSAAQFNEMINVYKYAITVSLGNLLSVPPWVKALPSHVQSSALDQYRDARLWWAGTREWDAVAREWANESEITTSLDCDGLVISSGRTVTADPIIGKLHGELALAHRNAGRLGVEVVLDDTSHDSILTNQSHAARCTAEIISFLANAVELSDK